MAVKKEKEYVYKPKDPSGNDYAALSGMSDVHRAALDAAGQEWNNAKTPEEKAAAHDKAEKIRGLYDYSGGTDGSEYIPTGTKSNAGLAFAYGGRPIYKSDYSERIDAMLNQILNQEKFSYDPATDPAYQQYEQMYTRNGQKAMEDTLAQVSARTGGLASSYAGMAAQQTYDGYMAELADKVPELRQLAYEMYLADMDSQIQKLGLLQGMDDTQYSRYRNQVGDWENDRDFAYGAHRDNVSDQRYDQEWQYQLGRDALEDQRYDQEWAYQKERDAIEDARYNQEWAYQVAQDKKGDGKPNLTAAQVLEALESGVVNDSTMEAYEYYFGEEWSGEEEPAAPVEPTGGASGYNSVLATIDRAPGLTQKEKVAIIEDAFTRGKLTEEEGEALLAHIGY